MRRWITFLLVAATPALALAQRIAPPQNPRASPLWLGPTRNIYQPFPVTDRPIVLDERGRRRLIGWGQVGRCVVAADRVNSVTYLDARPRSADEWLAARRLRPIFTACQARYAVGQADSVPFRRAAIADALGVTMEDVR